MHTPRHIALLAALLLLTRLHTAHAQTAPTDSVRLVFHMVHSEYVTTVVCSPDGKSCLSGSDASILTLWELSTGSVLRTLKGHSGPITSVAFSSNGLLALSGSKDGTARLWDVLTGQQILAYPLKWAHSVTAVAFNPDGKYIFVGDEEGFLTMCETTSGKVVREFTQQVVFLGTGQSGVRINSVVISPDGQTAVTTSGERYDSYDSTSTVKIWSVASGQERHTCFGHKKAVTCVAISPDGQTALSGSLDGFLKLWDLSTGKEIRTFEKNKAPVLSVAFSPDGRSAVSGGYVSPPELDFFGGGLLSNNHRHNLVLWNVATGKKDKTLRDQPYSVNAVTFSPDGRYLISAGDNKCVLLWDLRP